MSTEEIILDPEKYLEINNLTNAVDYLEKALFYFKSDDIFRWKWISISLFGALYGFLITVLAGSGEDSIFRYTKRKNKRVKRVDKKYLINLNEAVKRSKKKEYMPHFTYSKVMKYSNDEIEGIRIVQKIYRDNFVHFGNECWIIGFSEINDLTNNFINVIDRLINDTGNYEIYGEEKDKANFIIREFRKILNNKG